EACHVTRGRGDGSPTRSARAEITTRAAADVEIVQVVRMRALFVFNFKNDLVLVVWLLDQIDVILGVGVAHQALNRRGRTAIRRGAIAVDVDPEAGRFVVVVGANT